MYSCAAQIKKINGNVVTVGFRDCEDKDNVEATFDPEKQKLVEGAIVSVIHGGDFNAKVKYKICGGIIENPGPWKNR